MDNEGSLYVVWLNKGEPGEREFLARSLSLGSEHVEVALLDLHEKGSADFDYLKIPDDELNRFKAV